MSIKRTADLTYGGADKKQKKREEKAEKSKYVTDKLKFGDPNANGGYYIEKTKGKYSAPMFILEHAIFFSFKKTPEFEDYQTVAKIGKELSAMLQFQQLVIRNPILSKMILYHKAFGFLDLHSKVFGEFQTCKKGGWFFSSGINSVAAAIMQLISQQWIFESDFQHHYSAIRNADNNGKYNDAVINFLSKVLTKLNQEDKEKIGSRFATIIGGLDALQLMLTYKATKANAKAQVAKGFSKIASIGLAASALAGAGAFGLGPAIGAGLQTAANFAASHIGINDQVARHRGAIVDAVKEMLMSSMKNFEDALEKEKGTVIDKDGNYFTVERFREHVQVVLTLLARILVCDNEAITEHTVSGFDDKDEQFQMGSAPITVSVDSDIYLNPFSSMFRNKYEDDLKRSSDNKKKKAFPKNEVEIIQNLAQTIHMFEAIELGLTWDSSLPPGEWALDLLDDLSSVGDGLYGTPGKYFGEADLATMNAEIKKE